MNLRSKIIFRMSLVLLIGAIIGIALDRVFIRRHIRTLFEMRTEGIMVPLEEEILKKVPAENRKAVTKLLREHADRVAAIDGRFRSEIDASFKTLLKSLSAFLTGEKIKEIEAIIPGPPPGWKRSPRRPPFGKIKPPPGRGEPPPKPPIKEPVPPPDREPPAKKPPIDELPFF